MCKLKIVRCFEVEKMQDKEKCINHVILTVFSCFNLYYVLNLQYKFSFKSEAPNIAEI